MLALQGQTAHCQVFDTSMGLVKGFSTDDFSF